MPLFAALPPSVQQAFRKVFGKSPFRHRDFRLLWIGAFASFTGSWIQNVAQGWLVWDLTQDEARLAFISFCAMAPVSIFGPFAGTLADTFNKRKVLILAQATFAAGALFLMIAVAGGFVQYWHIVMVAIVIGIAGAIEMPTRQSVVSRVVPPEDIPAAIPLNALTFNGARVIGPAIGGVLLAVFGVAVCYGINGLSYLALILAVIAIRADLRPIEREPQPIQDLIFEGMLYTMRDVRLKTLLFLEAAVSVFGMFYLILMPAIAREMLGLGQKGLGIAMSTIGIGAIIGIIAVTKLSGKPVKARLVLSSMTCIGIALFALGFVRTPILAFPLLALVGACAIMQFNTTNTLFQLISPDHLKGRVLSMHIWAISGLGPFGFLLFGWIAREASIPIALHTGGACIMIGALWGWAKRARLKDVDVPATPQPVI
jgi:MFS family permease